MVEFPMLRDFPRKKIDEPIKGLPCLLPGGLNTASDIDLTIGLLKSFLGDQAHEFEYK
jgi:hypothetical protein